MDDIGVALLAGNHLITLAAFPVRWRGNHLFDLRPYVLPFFGRVVRRTARRDVVAFCFFGCHFAFRFLCASILARADSSCAIALLIHITESSQSLTTQQLRADKQSPLAVSIFRYADSIAGIAFGFSVFRLVAIIRLSARWAVYPFAPIIHKAALSATSFSTSIPPNKINGFSRLKKV
jgi:hypothetical protein